MNTAKNISTRRAIAARTIAAVALAGALTGTGIGVAAGTANAKPRVCASMDRDIAQNLNLAWQAEEREDWDSASWHYTAAERINKRYEAAGCRG